jgi:hypothetical protein
MGLQVGNGKPGFRVAGFYCWSLYTSQSQEMRMLVEQMLRCGLRLALEAGE